MALLQVDHIIVQAGGRGTRLEHLTANKPKALVPVENLPMIFHLFRRFPDKRYTIIADYKKEVLGEYLHSFADVSFQMADAIGTGTCSGVAQAVALLPDGEAVMLIWSDLILPDNFDLPVEAMDYIGLSQTFPCRWKYFSGVFTEERSIENGVAGLFIFRDKSVLANVPESGEIVKWMQEQNMHFAELGLAGTREFGLLSEYSALGLEKCRPFNKMTIESDTLIKEPIDQQGESLALREREWYRAAISKGVKNIPEIISYEPLKMEKICGENVYEYSNIPLDEKAKVLLRIIEALKALHSLDSIPANVQSLREAYFGKTVERLARIRRLPPFSDRKTITINGRQCRNIFFHEQEFEKKLDQLQCGGFAFIHGDCTFSNIMLRNGVEPIFIDPRGYFGHTKLYGDPNYDWAKLYYSVVGNYDRFNLKDFRLEIGEKEVRLNIGSNKWEELEEELFALSGADPQTIKLIHAVIWLSLTTYAWHDYDSICGAYYNGLYYLEETL